MAINSEDLINGPVLSTIKYPELKKVPSSPDDAPEKQAATSGVNAAVDQFYDASDKQKGATAVYWKMFGEPPQKKAAEVKDAPQWEGSAEYKNAQIGKAGMKMGFALLMASLIGPLFMRTGAKGALSALTAAINGWKAGDEAKWSAARDDYDKHIKYIQHNNDKMMAEADKVFHEQNVDYNTRLHNVNMLAIKYGMQKQASYEDYVKYFAATQKANDKLNHPTKTSDQKNFEATSPGMAEKEGTPEYADAYKKYLSEKGGGAEIKAQAQKIGDAIMSGKQSPVISGFGMAKLAAPLKAYLAEKGYDLKQAELDFGAQKKFLSTLNGTQQLRLRQAIAFTSESLPIIEDLAKKWDAGQFPIINKANLIAAKNGVYGKDAQQIATKLDTQIADLVSELGTVYKGGNSSTDHSLELAAKNLSSSWDKDQLLSNVDLIRKNLAIRKNSIESSGVVGTSKDVPRGTGATTQAPPLSDVISQLKAHAQAGDKKAQDYLKSKGIQWQSQQ